MERKHFRKAKVLVFSKSLWRKRLVFWFGAIAVGMVASWFAVAANWAKSVFDAMLSHGKYWPLVVSPTVFAFVAWCTQRYFPGATGSGIPQAIAARVLRDPDSRRFLLGTHVILGKAGLLLLCLMGGASVGREGPTVQLGAGLLLLFASVGGLSAQRGVVLAGAAAGVAAAFNTPLAGIVFAIEEMARAFEYRNSSMVLAAIVFSGAASMSIAGNYDYFGYTGIMLSVDRDLFAVIVVGICGGVLGSLFARLVIDGEKYLRGVGGSFGNRRPAVFAALCGLAIACLGILTHGATYGAGYHMGHDLLQGDLAPAWWQAPAKLAATAISAISGIPGGIFSPSLSIGAAVGGELSLWFPNTPRQGIVLLAMVAYFAGVTQAPITAFVIVLEITGKATTAVPLIAAALIASGISRLLCPTSLYHSLAKTFILRAGQSGEASRLAKDSAPIVR